MWHIVREISIERVLLRWKRIDREGLVNGGGKSERDVPHDISSTCSLTQPPTHAIQGFGFGKGSGGGAGGNSTRVGGDDEGPQLLYYHQKQVGAYPSYLSPRFIFSNAKGRKRTDKETEIRE